MAEKITVQELIQRHNALYFVRQNPDSFEKAGTRLAVVENLKTTESRLESFMEIEKELIEKHAETDESGEPLLVEIKDGQQLPPEPFCYQFEDEEAFHEDRQDALNREVPVDFLTVPKEQVVTDEGEADFEVLDALSFMFE
jgi:hypothetical protein